MLSLVVQAGGESRRMGQDKALLPFMGKPLIQRVIARAAPVADEILVTSNRPEAYAFLGLPLFPDFLPGRGALGGLYTALMAASYPLVAVVACDMPFVNPILLTDAREVLENNPLDAVIPRTEEGTEPFHAVYRRDTCLPAIYQALLQKKRRVNSWFPAARIHYLSPAEIRLSDPSGLAFWNVNTAEEFQQAEAIAADKSRRINRGE